MDALILRALDHLSNALKETEPDLKLLHVDAALTYLRALKGEILLLDFATDH
jgi:hypothetical protein